MKHILTGIATAFALSVTATAAESTPETPLTVVTPGLTLGLTADGEVTGPFRAGTTLDGCRVEGNTAVRKLDGGGYAFTRNLADAQGHRCAVTDSFIPTKDSIRWEIEITGAGEPWSVPITASVQHPAKADTLFWTSWDAPPQKDLLTPVPLDVGRVYNYCVS